MKYAIYCTKQAIKSFFLLQRFSKYNNFIMVMLYLKIIEKQIYFTKEIKIISEREILKCFNDYFA